MPLPRDETTPPVTKMYFVSTIRYIYLWGWRVGSAVLAMPKESLRHPSYSAKIRFCTQTRRTDLALSDYFVPRATQRSAGSKYQLRKPHRKSFSQAKLYLPLDQAIP